MAYEWDPAKNRANVAKHGVDFADAAAVLEDSVALTRPDGDARGERRFVPLGMEGFGRYLVVVHAERGAHIRLMATKRERSDYEG